MSIPDSPRVVDPARIAFEAFRNQVGATVVYLGIDRGWDSSEPVIRQRFIDAVEAVLRAAHYDELRTSLETIADNQSNTGYLRDIRGGNAEIAQKALGANAE